MRRVSLDTPNEVLWARDNTRDLERIMQARPTPNNERVNTRRTRNGNIIIAVQR